VDGLKFLRSFLRKLLATGFVMLFLGVIALSEGAGYETIEVSHRTLTLGPRIVDYGPHHGGSGEIGLGCIVFICNVDVALNPFLYPLSYLMGNGKSSCISSEAACPLVMNLKDEAMDSAKFGAVFPEFVRNLPYIFVIGFLIESVIEKLYRKVLFQTRPNRRVGFFT